MKYVIVLNKDIENWIALNTTAHMCAKLGSVVGEELSGEEPVDKSGIKHSGIPKFANAVLVARDSNKIRSIIDKAKNFDLVVIDYPKEGLDTYTDEEFCEAVSNKKNEEIEFIGCCIFGKTEIVNKVTGDLKLWK